MDRLDYGNEHIERFFLRGVEPEYAHALPLFSIEQGRFITQYDDDHARNVVVIGAGIADSLFPLAAGATWSARSATSLRRLRTLRWAGSDRIGS